MPNSSPKLAIVGLQQRGAGAIDPLELSEALCSLGVPHTAYVAAGSELSSKWTVGLGREVVWLKTYEPSFWSVVNAMLSFRWLNLVSAIRKQQPDLVFVANFHPFAVPLVLLSQPLSLRVAAGVHENPFLPKEGDGWFSLFLQRLVLRNASALLAFSRFTAGEVAKQLPGKPVAAVTLGSYRHLVGAVPDRARGNTVKFLFIGRLEPHKGLGVLARAFALARQRDPGISLTVAGGGAIELSVRESLAASGARVVNHWLPVPELVQLVKESDAVVLPYLAASQSGVASLALAAGLPIVASRVGGLPEQVRDGVNGLLFEPGNAAALAEKMNELAASKERHGTLALGSRQLAAGDLSFEPAARALLQLAGAR